MTLGYSHVSFVYGFHRYDTTSAYTERNSIVHQFAGWELRDRLAATKSGVIVIWVFQVVEEVVMLIVGAAARHCKDSIGTQVCLIVKNLVD
jgi:hypothetical protein